MGLTLFETWSEDGSTWTTNKSFSGHFAKFEIVFTLESVPDGRSNGSTTKKTWKEITITEKCRPGYKLHRSFDDSPMAESLVWLNQELDKEPSLEYCRRPASDNIRYGMWKSSILDAFTLVPASRNKGVDP